MSIVLKSGLVALKNGVAKYFDEQGIRASVSLGWSKVTRQDNEGDGQANRVIFIPCDKSGKAGKISLPEQPGDRPILDESGNVVGKVRALRSWARVVTVSVWACDTTDLTNEDLQAEATDTLLEQTIQAVHRAAVVVAGGQRGLGHANVDWGDIETNLEPVDRSFGRELVATMTYRHPIFDQVQDIRFPTNVQVNRVLNPTT